MLTGRDLLYFRSPSSRNDLIKANLLEYVTCIIDVVLVNLKEEGRKLPLDVIKEYSPTMEQLIEETKDEWHYGVSLDDGGIKRDCTPVTIDTFDYYTCPTGRLFDRYPDQLRSCIVVELRENSKFMGLDQTGFWTTYSPKYYQREVLDKGLHLNGVEVYRHRLWKEWNKVDFATVTSRGEIRREYHGGINGGIRYTGRTHEVKNEIFYEIDLILYDYDTEEVEHPFIELVEEMLREAENLLRKNHGLPRIGAGWISETRLYRLVQSIFPDAQQHVSPDWLKPQHLDILVPSRNIAFEYQGRQHFEPIDFFGGKEAFEKTKKRDKRKMHKCKTNDVLLIYWLYDEPIDQQLLTQKLKQLEIIGGTA